MKVRYTVPAIIALDEILGALAAVSPSGSRRVAEQIKSAERLLEQFPQAGSPTRLPWLRRIKVSGYSYIIFYEVTFDAVLIHAVRHGARRSFDEQLGLRP